MANSLTWFNDCSPATWAARQGLVTDDPALAAVTDDDWAFEELSPETTTGTDPPATTTPN